MNLAVEGLQLKKLSSVNYKNDWRIVGINSRLRISKLKIKTMMICLTDSQEIFHKESVTQGQAVHQYFYKDALERFRKRIIRVRPNIKNICVLHHDNVALLCHTAISINQ